MKHVDKLEDEAVDTVADLREFSEQDLKDFGIPMGLVKVILKMLSDKSQADKDKEQQLNAQNQ